MLVKMPRAALAVLVGGGVAGSHVTAVDLQVEGRSLPALALASARAHADTVALVPPPDDGDWWGALTTAILESAPVPADEDVVVVHEVHRALAGDEVWERVVEAVHAGAGASVPSLPVTDTVRDRHGVLFDRATLVECQSPRAYRASTLRAMAATDATSELDALQASGVDLAIVAGASSACVIRTAGDAAVIRARSGR